MRTDFDARWDELAEEVLSGMKEWRLQHPKATLREQIEQSARRNRRSLNQEVILWLERAATRGATIAAGASGWRRASASIRNGSTPAS